MLPITDTPQQPHAKCPGRTLVASHSFSFARREWIEASAPLSEQFRVVAVDAPGHGEAREIPGYTMAEMAAAFAATINELGLTDYVLVGHSMTGKVMQILASPAGAGWGSSIPGEARADHSHPARAGGRRRGPAARTVREPQGPR